MLISFVFVGFWRYIRQNQNYVRKFEKDFCKTFFYGILPIELRERGTL